MKTVSQRGGFVLGLVVGLLVGLSALAGAMLAPIVVTLFLRRLGVARLMVGGFLVAALSAGGMLAASDLLGLALANTAMAAAAALLQTAVYTWLGDRVDDRNRTAALSLSLFPLYAGAVVGPLITTLVSRLGTPRPGDELGLTPVFVGSTILLALGIFAVRRLRAEGSPSR